MSSEAIEAYLADDSRRGDLPGAFIGAAGGAACGDLVRLSLAIEGGMIAAARFESEGCAATRAAASAVADEAEGLSVLDAARLGADEISEALGGLSPQGRHAAELAGDALHRALSDAASSSDQPLASSPRERDRVLVAMSGGVDSAVAALLEAQDGREVVGVTLKLWADRRTDAAKSCCSPLAVLGARDLAHSLGLPHLTLDLEGAFRATVVERFVRGYDAGETPNPCVLCNGEVRIDAMLDLAERISASALATGHYARVGDDGEGPLLKTPVDAAKDQTYMLSALRPEALARLRFPLSRLAKPQVREIARQAGLAVARKPESQDLCFLAGEGKRSFLERHSRVRERAGEVVDRGGRVLGRHPGYRRFTVGQRRGIGVAADEPLYVLETDPAANRVVVGARSELAARRVRLRGAVLHRDGGRVDRAKLRYRSHAIGCRLDAARGTHPELWVALDEPAYGVAPGQAACLLDGDLVVGHATIAAAA